MLKPRMLIWLVALAIFTLISALALSAHGYVGLWAFAFEGPAHWQIFADLSIACFIATSFMIRDARERRLPILPYLLLTLAGGSFGLLGYMIHRELARRASPGDAAAPPPAAPPAAALLIAALALGASGCASVSAETPEAAGELREASVSEVAGALTQLGLAGEAWSGRRESLTITRREGEAAESFKAESLNFELWEDELGRVAWDFDAIELRIKQVEEGARLEEVVLGGGSQLIRIVTRTLLSPVGFASRPEHEAEGLFLLYKGSQTDRVDARGELALRFSAEGQQRVELPSGSLEALQLVLELELELEEATELVEGAPEVSALSLAARIWWDEGPALLSQRATGARGPVRVVILDLEARRG